MSSLLQRIFDPETVERIITQGLKVVGILVGALVVNLVASRALRRLESRAGAVEATRVVEARRAATAVGLARNAVKWAIFVLAVIMILGALGIEATAILAGVGFIGLAVGFGAQALVRDVVAGFFITVEGQLAVGDQVEINNVYGVVDEIGLRTTCMILPGGQVRYFGNGAITNIVRYPTGSAPYVLIVPVAPDKVEQTRETVLGILADLHTEQDVLAAPARVRDSLDLPTYGHVLRFEVDVLPAGKAAFEAKAVARITELLAERGLPLPQGRQVVVQSDLATLEQREGLAS